MFVLKNGGRLIIRVVLYSDQYGIYNYIILYTIIYRAPGVANGNNHFLLHAAVHPGLHCTEFDGWTLIGCYVTHVTQWPRCWTLIGCHHAKFVSKLKYFNLSEFVAPQILVNALACARRKCGATNQKNSPDTRLYVHFVWDLVAIGVNALEKFQDRLPKLTFLFRK